MFRLLVPSLLLSACSLLFESADDADETPDAGALDASVEAKDANSIADGASLPGGCQCTIDLVVGACITVSRSMVTCSELCSDANMTCVGYEDELVCESPGSFDLRLEPVGCALERNEDTDGTCLCVEQP